MYRVFTVISAEEYYDCPEGKDIDELSTSNLFVPNNLMPFAIFNSDSADPRITFMSIHGIMYIVKCDVRTLMATTNGALTYTQNSAN